MIYFNIKDRYSGRVMFTAFIAADDDTPIGVKIGLAVKWALRAKKPLAWADLTGANLAGADLTEANLTEANLTGAYLTEANLTGAYLNRANLAGARLVGARLVGANLTEARLVGADLTGANLTQASLTKANLTWADLADANLAGANVRGEMVTRVIARLNREIDPYSFVAFALQAGGVKVLAGCRWLTVAEYRAHVAADYPETDKATETARILDYIEARAADLGIALEPPCSRRDEHMTPDITALRERLELMAKVFDTVSSGSLYSRTIREASAALQALGASHG